VFSFGILIVLFRILPLLYSIRSSRHHFLHSACPNHLNLPFIITGSVASVTTFLWALQRTVGIWTSSMVITNGRHGCKWREGNREMSPTEFGVQDASYANCPRLILPLRICQNPISSKKLLFFWGGAKPHRSASGPLSTPPTKPSGSAFCPHRTTARFMPRR